MPFQHAGAANVTLKFFVTFLVLGCLNWGMPKDEEQLLRDLSTGSTEAFDVIYDRYSAALFSFLLRLSQRQDVAEDLLQETWVRFSSKSHTLVEGSSVRAWLFVVARNTFLNFRRWRLLDSERIQELALIGLTPAPEPSPFEALAGSQLEGRIERAIAALPLRYREAVLLVSVEGFAPQEAASLCGVRPEAMRKRLSRARAMLRSVLETDEVRSEAAAPGRSL